MAIFDIPTHLLSCHYKFEAVNWREVEKLKHELDCPECETKGRVDYGNGYGYSIWREICQSCNGQGYIKKRK